MDLTTAIKEIREMSENGTLITRGYLKRVYEDLPRKTKSEWAYKAGYKSYQGLYRYLNIRPDENAYTDLIRALFSIANSKVTYGTTAEDAINSFAKSTEYMLENLNTTVDMCKARGIMEYFMSKLDEKQASIQSKNA